MSVDGGLIAGRDKATLTGWLMDVNTWETQTNILSGECEVTGVAVVDLIDEDLNWIEELWFSCGDGTVRPRSWDGETLSTVADVPTVIDVDESLSGIWYYYDLINEVPVAQLYALSVAADDSVVVHTIDLAGTVDPQVYNAWPESVPRTKFNEAVISGDQLVIHHDSNNMSVLQLPDGPASLVTLQQGADLNITVVDISPSPSGVYAVGSGGNMAELLPLVPAWSTLFTGLIDPAAVVASQDDDDSWIVITGEQIKIWEMDGNGAIIGDNDNPYWESEPDAGSKIQDAITYDSYVFGGGIGGNLHVATARPWVYPGAISVSPTTELTDGDPATLTFMADSSGSYEIFRGGTRYGDGDRVAGGDISADVEEIVELEVDLDWDEGQNQIFAIVTASATNLTGHAAGSVLVDNPPRPPDLTNSNLDFGDSELFLRFDGITDADLDYYEVYITETKWSEADWQTLESDGPEYDGNAGIGRKNLPIIIQAAGGDSVDKTLKPLDNHVKYYVGVRAIDQGGLVGPMSNVISETPRPTHTAADLANEKGGSPCSTSGQTAGWMVVLFGAAALFRRRVPFSAAGAVGLLALALAAPAANAQSQDKKGPAKDLTPTYGDFEVRYGGITINDDNINSVYDENPTNILQMEFGPQFFKVVEVDFGIGFFQELAFKIDDSGIQSGERTMLTWFPLGLDASLRAHIIDEQFVVPFARAGFDYIMYSEKADAGGDSKDVLRGGKFGNHVGLGVNILLDTFAKERASLLEATSGINDSYLVIEWRKQRIDQRDLPWAPAPNKVRGLNFSGNMFTIGLKLDY